MARGSSQVQYPCDGEIPYEKLHHRWRGAGPPAVWHTAPDPHSHSSMQPLFHEASRLRIPLVIDFNHPKYLYLIFTGPPLNIYQIFMNIPLKLVAPRCFGSSGFRHFWATLTRNCRKFCFQQDTRPVCGPAPSRDLCLYKLVIPIIICLWHNEQSGWLFAIASTKYKYERRRV